MSSGHRSSANPQRPRVPRWRWSDLRFLAILLAPLWVLALLVQHRVPQASWALLAYALVAALEAWWPGAQRSPRSVAPTPGWLEAVLRLYVPLQLGMQLAAGAMALQGSWAEALQLGLCVGVVSGVIGTSVGHELGHSPYRADRLLGWLLLCSVGYGQFMVEHYRGHHPRAALLGDPTTAREHEGLWRYLLRKLPASLLDASRLEARRLRQGHRTWLSSPLAWSWALTAVAVLGMVTALALPALLFWLIQSVLAIWFIEAQNYIQHYGLVRRIRNVWMVPFEPGHAWNTDHWLSNTFFLQQQRHSDHHLQPWKPFMALEDLSRTPRLPTGYAGSLLLASVPPLWRHVMGRRLAQLRDPVQTDLVSTQSDLLRDSR